MGLFKFLKPVPEIAEETDPAVVKKQYRYWRLRIFYSMYIGYVFYYFSRKAFAFAMPTLISDFGFEKGKLGFILSVSAVTYGVSKFISGMIADRSNPRYFMAIGLMLTGVLNILFGFSSTIIMFALILGINGWFQGWGWPPCARLLTHWYSQKERGTWWGFWNSSHNVGGMLIPLIVALFAQSLGWRWAMYVPGMLCILAGLFLINRLRDTPRSLGLPSIEKYRNDYPEEKHDDEKDNITAKEILFKYVLKNKLIWALAIAYFFVYIIRGAINDWSMVYFIQQKGYSQMKAGLCVFLFEFGGIFGSLAAGWASDKIFKGKRGPVNAIFCIGVVFAVAILWLSPMAIVAVDATLMFAIGFLIFGPQMLIGTAAAELSHKKAAGTSTGFIGCIAYLGAAVAGYPCGKITDIWGWDGLFLTLGVCGLVAVLFLLPLWSAKSYAKSKAGKEKEVAAEAEAVLVKKKVTSTASLSKKSSQTESSEDIL